MIQYHLLYNPINLFPEVPKKATPEQEMLTVYLFDFFDLIFPILFSQYEYSMRILLTSSKRI